MPATCVQEKSTPANTPPMEKSNEAEPQQLDVARTEGDAYGKALEAMQQEKAEGVYAPRDGGGDLEWRETPEEANAHIEVAVADAADGRFVPVSVSP